MPEDTKKTASTETFLMLLKEILEIQKLYHQSIKKKDCLKLADDKSEALLHAVQNKFADEGMKILAEIIQSIKQEESILSKENQTQPTDNDIPDMSAYQNHLQPEIYAKLLAFTKLAYLYENRGDPYEHAKKLALVFNDKQTALNYLAKSAANFTIENACSFTLPSPSEPTFGIWMSFAKKYLSDKQFQMLMVNAHEIEKLVESQNIQYRTDSKNKPGTKTSQKTPKMDITQTKLIANKKKEIETVNAEWKDLDKHHGHLEGYKGRSAQENKDRHTFLIAKKVKLNQELLALCAGVSLKDADLTLLNAYNEAYKINTEKALKYMLDNGLTKQDYVKFSKLKRQNDDEKIPPVLIDGATLGYPGCYVKKIDVLDELDAARAACLGKKTKCCQSLSGEAGEPCVIHGLTSPYGGFYVLCQGDINHPNIEDEIIAQCWTWRSQSGAIVLDSIEGPIRDKTTQNKIGIIFRGLAKELVTSGTTHKVVSGINSASAIKKIGIEPLSNPSEKFVDYEGYYDSGSQWVLYDKDCPFYLYGIDADCTSETEKKLISITRSIDPLAQSEFFTAVLNWTLLRNKKDLLEKIKEVFTIDRAEEINNMIATLKKYIDNELTGEEILSNIENNLLSINAVNAEGLTPLMWAIQHNLTDIALKLIEKGASIPRNDNNGLTTLMWASQQGEYQIVNTLLEKNADIAGTTSDRKTALMLAAKNGHLDIVLLLINHGAKINAKDRYGNTALMWAITNGKREVALKLIEMGADTSISDDKNKTTLMAAIQNDLTDVALELIKNGAKVNASDSSGNTALMIASRFGHENVVNTLIINGADPNAKDDNGKTALMAATKKSIAKELIAKGAQIDAKDKQGNTALWWSTINQYNEITLELLSLGADVKSVNDKKQTVLMYAVNYGYQDIALELIAKGADINAKDSTGKTVLMYAAEGGSVELVAELLSKGISLAEKDEEGKTALMFAKNGNIAQKLIEQGAKIDDSDNKGMTPLEHSIENECTDVALKLIEQGTKLNLHDPKFLFLAAEKCNGEVISKLLEKGADIHAKNEDDKTALEVVAAQIADRPNVEDTLLLLIEKGGDCHIIADNDDFEELLLYAILHDRQAAALKLIEGGVNINVADKQDKTALMWAIEKGYQDIALALIEKGADVNKIDEDGKTALMWTAISGKRDVIVARQLINHGSDIYVKDHEGKTALMWDEALNKIAKTPDKETSRKKFTPQYSFDSNTHLSHDEFDKCLRGISAPTLPNEANRFKVK